ncbi:hypothetical protein TVAG_080770 [Trichomonas vaginalis G3]|uniref:PAS domain-containing protein n=1 Tax=Trichomonas vaginalis (strain ATCC PRA-98 / G3) TaxID=412133 RepID=A2EPA0_TRIV3|nr:hypothetical protein TVAGG3_0679370 [Trichomonas vaginalis G3]EAY05485.1 hypothetical protein TVAG_080770 [Trichomonas vaginalis G3]KAI5507788.1 hypothetical protein TVAGG3_0679370 [Trichomonas vaginalis G3]|eukprot:XP_001317708.1 hypothetical protein [Trichomonas vaginalis G3]
METMLDSNSCSTDHFMFWARFSVVACQLLLYDFDHFILEFIIFFFFPIYIIFVIEMRLSHGVHVSIFAAILKDSPIFASPFIIFFNLHPNKYIRPTFLMIFLILVYTVIYYFHNIFMKKYSSSIMNEKIEPPFWIPLTNATVMRYAAETEADVECFENYLMLRSKLDPEEMIEVIRFLGIFKAHRSKIQLIISKWNGDSPYYDYQFYVFSRILRSGDKASPVMSSHLDDLHRNYLINLSLFWQKRHEKHFFDSFVYGLKASFAYIELVNYSQYLVYIYQRDPNIQLAYAEISLVALGDPQKSVLFRKYSNMIRDNPDACGDPVFKKTSIYYPLSNEIIERERSETTSGSSSNKISESNSKIRFHFDENVIYRNEDSNNSPIAMGVRKCSNIKPYGTILSFIIISTWAIVYIMKFANVMNNNVETVVEVRDLLQYSLQAAYKLTAGIVIHQIYTKFEASPANTYNNMQNKHPTNKFYTPNNIVGETNYLGKIPKMTFKKVVEEAPYDQKESEINHDIEKISENENIDFNNDKNYQNPVTKNGYNESYAPILRPGVRNIQDLPNLQNENFTDEEKRQLICIYKILNIHDEILDYSITAREDLTFQAKVLGYSSEFLASSSNDKCETLDGMEKLIKKSKVEIKHNLENYTNLTSKIINSTRFDETYKGMANLLYKLSLFGTLLSLVFIYIRIRTLLRRIPPSATEFLGSKERLSLLLLKKSLESWDLFRILFPSENTNGQKVTNTKSATKVPINPNLKRMKLGRYSSEADVNYTQMLTESSHHINLKDAKFSISFIGAENLLKTSNFALMSPFVNSSNSTANNSESEFSDDFSECSMTDNSAKDDDFIVAENIEKIDIVSKTISETIYNQRLFYISLIFIYFTPFMVAIFLNMKSNVFYLFQNENNKILLNRIKENVTQLHVHSIYLYESYKNNSNVSPFSGNISIYTRHFQKVEEEIDKMISTNFIGTNVAILIDGFVFICGLLIALYLELNVNHGLDSLFNIPIGYLDDLNKPKDKQPENKLPNNVIVATVDNNSKNIIDITQNVKEILGVESLDFIGKRFDEIFTPDDTKSDIRNYQVTAKRFRKFVTSKYKFDRISRVALFELTNQTNTKQNFITCLSKYVTPNIAKMICDDGLFKHHSDDMTIIIGRFYMTEYNNSTDKFFLTVQSLMQCYMTFHLLRCQGSCFYFIGSGYDPNTTLLFIRDIINGTKTSKEKIFKSFVVASKVFDAEIALSDEPYISIYFEGHKAQVSSAFAIPDYSVMFLNQTLQSNEAKVTEFNQNNVKGSYISFDDIEKCLTD